MMTENVSAMQKEGAQPLTWEECRQLLGACQRTWLPTTAGLLMIVSGALNFLLGVFSFVGAGFVPLAFTMPALAGPIFAWGLIALGVISVIGGIFALRRSSWPVALAGSIAALIPSTAFFFGMLSLIFVNLGKPEFCRR